MALSYYFHVILWLDRRGVVEGNGKGNDVPMCWGETEDMALAIASQPQGPWAAVGKDAALPIASHRCSVRSGYPCYLGPLLLPAWLLSTLSERPLTTFYASPLFLSHHNLCYSPQFHTDTLKAYFFLNGQNLYLNACFEDALLGFKKDLCQCSRTDIFVVDYISVYVVTRALHYLCCKLMYIALLVQGNCSCTIKSWYRHFKLQLKQKLVFVKFSNKSIICSWTFPWTIALTLETFSQCAFCALLIVL